MNKYALILTALLSGCSIVQWLPSSACEQVEYIRIGNQVSVKAECKV